MNTITIEDPVEANAMMRAEFPDGLSVWTSCGCRNGKVSWTAFVCPRDMQPDFSGEGATFAEAFAAVKAKAAEYDPMNQLRKKAEEMGLVLVRPA